MKRYFIDDGPENEDWPKRTDDLIDYPLVFSSAVTASVAFDVTGNFVLACEEHGEFACTSKACAPPPVGTGGSLPSGGSESGGGRGRKRRTEFGKRIAKMIADDPELAQFSRERSDPVMRRKAAYAEYHARLREAIARPIGSPDRNLLDPLVQVSGSDPDTIQYVLDLFKPEMLEPGYSPVPYSDEESAFVAVREVLLDKKRESMGGILFIDGKTVHFSLELDNATARSIGQPPVSTDRTLRSVMGVGKTVREEVETRLLRTLTSQRERAGAESARWFSEVQAIGKELAEKFPGAKIDLSRVFHLYDQRNVLRSLMVPTSALEGSRGSAYMRRDEIEKFLTEQMAQRKLLHFSDGARHLMLKESEEISRVVADTLKEVRKFGGKPSASPDWQASKTDQKSLLRLLEQGAADLPSTWTELSNKHSVISALFTSGRAQYNSSFNEVRIGFDVDVVRHELAHRMEHVVPGLLGLEERFFKFRTGDNPTFKSLNELVGSKDQYQDNEVADPDQFFNPYVGKDYKGEAYEIMSVGVQYVYRHLVTKMSTQGDMIQTQKLMDDDYIDFVLGAMMAVQWEA